MQDAAFKNTKFFIFPTITHPPTVRFVTPTVMAMLLIAVKFKKIHSTYIHPILTLAFFHIFLFRDQLRSQFFNFIIKLKFAFAFFFFRKPFNVIPENLSSWIRNGINSVSYAVNQTAFIKSFFIITVF